MVLRISSSFCYFTGYLRDLKSIVLKLSALMMLSFGKEAPDCQRMKIRGGDHEWASGWEKAEKVVGTSMWKGKGRALTKIEAVNILITKLHVLFPTNRSDKESENSLNPSFQSMVWFKQAAGRTPWARVRFLPTENFPGWHGPGSCWPLTISEGGMPSQWWLYVHHSSGLGHICPLTNHAFPSLTISPCSCPGQCHLAQIVWQKDKHSEEALCTRQNPSTHLVRTLDDPVLFRNDSHCEVKI